MSHGASSSAQQSGSGPRVVTASDPLPGSRLGEGERGFGWVERSAPTYHVTTYQREGAGRLDGRRFAAMFLSGNEERVWDGRFDVYRDTAVGSRRKLWAHWGGCGANDNYCLGRYADMPCVCCTEEVAYERRLADVFCSPGTHEEVYDDALRLDDVQLARPFDALWFVSNHFYWTRDLDFEVHMRRAPLAPVLCGWNNVEIFELLRAHRA